MRRVLLIFFFFFSFFPMLAHWVISGWVSFRSLLLLFLVFLSYPFFLYWFLFFSLLAFSFSIRLSLYKSLLMYFTDGPQTLTTRKLLLIFSIDWVLPVWSLLRYSLQICCFVAQASISQLNAPAASVLHSFFMPQIRFIFLFVCRGMAMAIFSIC